MKKLSYRIFLLLFLTSLRGYAQVETKRWWNVGASSDTERAVFCTETEVMSVDELILMTGETQDKSMKLQVFLRIIRAYQTETLIYKAIQYADSAMRIATEINDSLAVCRVHTASVYNMDLTGNPAGMLEEALLAEQWIPWSVKGTIEEFKVHSAKGDAYFKLIWYDQAEKEYRKAEKIIETLGYEKCKGCICMSLGRTMQSAGKMDKAMDLYQEAAGVFQVLNDTLNLCILYSNMASTYSSLGFYEKQLEYLFQTLNLSKELDDPIQQAAIYKEIATFYREREDSVLTMNFYRKAIETYDKVPHSFSTTLGDSYNDMADFYHYLNDNRKALYFQRKSVESYSRYPRPVALMIYKLGYLYLDNGQYDSAYHYFKEAYGRSRALNDPRLLATCCKGLACYYSATGNVKKAISFAENSYTNAQKINWIELTCEISEMLSGLYASDNRFEQAYLFQMRYRDLKDTLNMENKGREVARLSAQIEFADKEAQMSDKISTQQKRIRIQSGITFLMGCILALVCISVIIIWRNNQLRKEINKKLREQKEDLETFNEELTSSNEELVSVNDELKRTYDELDHYKNDLELMVDEKTAELQKALVKAQDSDRFKTAFFANISHEIRTPLNAILGFLQFIFKSDVPPDQREQMISLINSNAFQLLSMVDDIVDLSKIDSGLMVIRKETCNIDQLLNSVYAEMEQVILYSGKTRLALVLEIRLPLRHVNYMIDGVQVKKILLQLLSNAIKFTEKGYILFGCELRSDCLQFFVEDTGIGIASEYKDKIFKRFWKQGDAFTQRYRGVGIGLPICESLIGLMGGKIDVDSVHGQGTTFRFTISI